ncbi:MAG TPA: hypothetical protein VEI48_12225 [Candidatus Sulfotelmatobacter sp.]|nr:hypothetical protein [Candidatus Sulfotelmatobacter sp.]
MTPDQVSAFFDAGESFVEGTIAAALVALWILALSLHVARPYMVANLHKFTLRLGADLWWIVYVALRDLILVQVFLGSFIFFYPDVVSEKDLPVTGGLAAACAFAVLLMKLVSRGDAHLGWFRWQTILLGLGTTLYVVPYVLGVQLTNIDDPTAKQIASIMVSSQNTDWSLPLCYLSAALVGVMGIAAVVYNLRRATDRKSQAVEA